jgi:predicted ribosome quality control (RQC) complex YloA/Tae2 family protein
MHVEDEKHESVPELEGELKEVKHEIEELEKREEKIEGEIADKKHEYNIKVNRKDFHWKEQFITGHQVLGLVGEDDGLHGVAILRSGSEQDIPVKPDQSVDLSDEKNRHFKTFLDKSTEGR